MPVTVRLSSETESKLSVIASMQNKTKSDIIKESLDLYFQRFSNSKTPFELGKNLFGKNGSQVGDLSVKGEKYLREKFNAKKRS